MMIATAVAAFLMLGAQDAPVPVRIGNWLVGPQSLSSCQMETHFGDHYLLNISENAEGDGALVLSDDRWILNDGDAKPATYSWDGWKTSHKGTFNAIQSGGSKSYLVMDTDSSFTEDMVAAKGFWLRVPGVDFDDDFAIPEAKELVLALAACNSKLDPE